MRYIIYELDDTLIERSAYAIHGYGVSIRAQLMLDGYMPIGGNLFFNAIENKYKSVVKGV